jgi:Fe-S-cluster formation regulator IscX/YfhJ|tara:strand:- start:318 stop:518 length:201 start_codon:yes stop_codon:yes gene_type:complete
VSDIKKGGSTYDPIRREILADFYNIRQEIMFTICDKADMHPKTIRFLDVLKYAITEFEKIEEEFSK